MSSQTPQNLPLAGALADEADEEGQPTEAGPTVGTSDAEADAARSGAEVDPTHVARDNDGVPVGHDDVEADKRASGA